MFTRNSVAYTQDGTQVPTNIPRFEALSPFDVVFVISFAISPFTRNSEAYNIDYSLVNTNIPRYWNLGTKIPLDDVTAQKLGVDFPLVNNLQYSQYDPATNQVTLYTETTTKTFYLPDYISNHLRIIFKGTNSTGSISITINGSTLTYTNALTSSDRVVVDCIRYKVEKNFTADTITGTYPSISPGKNTISYSTSGGATLTYLVVEIRCKYYTTGAESSILGLQVEMPALPDYPILPLQSDLIDVISDLSMTYSRNSIAYNLDYTQANSNIPRYWPLGTKTAN